jgi:hypothetical protein
MAGQVGAHLVAWSQTRIDSRRPGPVADLRPGVRWEWRGRAIPLQDVAVEDDRGLWRAIQRIVPAPRLRDGLVGDPPVLDRAIKLVHHTSIYDARLVELADLARPMILFREGLPPQGVQLLVAPPSTAGHHMAVQPDAPLTALRIRV